MDFVTQPKRKSSPKKKVLIIVILCALLLSLIAIILGSTGKREHPEKESFVPNSISRQVPFPVYYPNPDTLPKGYTFDQNSFSTNGAVVVYSVSYQTDKKIAFTLQKKPSNNELDIFYAKQIPLRTEVKTALGTAAISAINNQRFLSFPISTDVWLIATAPFDIEPTVLEEIAKHIIH